jgi:hypothetical protein
VGRVWDRQGGDCDTPTVVAGDDVAADDDAVGTDAEDARPGRQPSHDVFVGRNRIRPVVVYHDVVLDKNILGDWYSQAGKGKRDDAGAVADRRVALHDDPVEFSISIAAVESVAWLCSTTRSCEFPT